MSNLATISQGSNLDGLERVLLEGDLGGLNQEQRVKYYSKVCESVGLNPLTQPFEYLKLQGKTILYAKRGATDQLRQIHKVSVTISSRERMDDIYVVTARATTPDGRCDESIGAVPLKGLSGEALANALMKGETKAKRRVTLAICGLSMLDELEVASVQAAEAKPAGKPGVTLDQLAGGGETRPLAALGMKNSDKTAPASATAAATSSPPSAHPEATALADVDPAALVDGHNFAARELGNAGDTYDQYGLLEPQGECPVFGPGAAPARRGKPWSGFPGVVREVILKDENFASEATSVQACWARYIVAHRQCAKLAGHV